MTTPEGLVKAKLNRALAHIVRLYRFMPVQNGMGAPGLDYFLCVNGKFVAIETKAKGKTLTDRQNITKQRIIDAGGLVYVVDDDASITATVRALELLSI